MTRKRNLFVPATPFDIDGLTTVGSVRYYKGYQQSNAEEADRVALYQRQFEIASFKWPDDEIALSRVIDALRAAFHAGKQERSREILNLLQDGRR